MSVQAAEIVNPGLVEALLAQDPSAILFELAGVRLLLPAAPVGQDAAALRHGQSAGGRPLLWAFTDAEALAAWDRHPAESAVALAASDLGELDNGSATVLALNAAGPGAFLMGPEALSGADVSRVSKVRRAAAAQLVALEGRHELRAAAREAHRRGIAAVASGRYTDAAGELERAIEACNALGDRLHGASAALDLAPCLARAGALSAALGAWERAAEVLTVFGEIDLALGGLLDAAEVAARSRRTEDAARLSVAALELCAGPVVGERIVTLWRSLDAD
jgi:tetratricopeptide (TPR) repeat protein